MYKLYLCNTIPEQFIKLRICTYVFFLKCYNLSFYITRMIYTHMHKIKVFRNSLINVRQLKTGNTFMIRCFLQSEVFLVFYSYFKIVCYPIS